MHAHDHSHDGPCDQDEHVQVDGPAHHSHAHPREHGSIAPARQSRALWIALGITAGIFVVEVVGALLTGSLALLADSGHMLSDVAALGLALFAFWIAARPATPERTFGYHRVEILAAMANAVTLVVVALYVFWEAYQRLWDPPAIQSMPMLGVAVVGLLANAASAWILMRDGGENLNIRGALLHVLGDMLGSVGAIVASVVMLTTGWFYADPIVSVFIGILILVGGWRLLRESLDVLLEATPRGVDVRDVENALTSVPGVRGVHDLHVWTVTSGYLAMSGHVTLADDGDGHAVLPIATAVVRDRFGIGHVTLQMERLTDEEIIHHGCYLGPDMTACVVPPARREPAGHHHGHHH